MNSNLWPVHAFIDSLVRAGVQAAVISPGSRNTPLTMALVEHPDIEVFSHLDERSAAFFALGMAKGTGVPVVIECTSGTATANYLPAVMEAFEARVPMIVVTADRPQQLRDVGANQAVRQSGMYGQHVKWSVDMPLPDGTDIIARHAVVVAARAVAVSLEAPMGPVHINYPFVEPLMPPRLGELTGDQFIPTVSIQQPRRSLPAEDALSRLQMELQRAVRPLIILGPQTDKPLATAVRAFAGRHRIPILADILSQARFESDDSQDVVFHYDAILTATPDVIDPPDVLLRFGAQPTSKTLAMFMARIPKEAAVFIHDDSPFYRDASFVATEIVLGDMIPWLDQVELDMSSNNGRYNAGWLAADQIAKTVIEQYTNEVWFEGSAVRLALQSIDEKARFFIGNSRPVRDADALGVAHPDVIVDANRGVSGIDGVTSTAFGLAAADLTRPTVLCIGDVSFYHDLNGLLAASRFHVPLTVVLIQNDGGGIFQHLSQSDRTDTLSFFTTPHGLEFDHIVAAYGGSFCRVTDGPSLQAALKAGVASQGLTVIEVPFENAASVGAYRQLYHQLRLALTAQPR